MRRVLLVDDFRLAPRLARLRAVLGLSWDALLAPRDQLEFWKTTEVAASSPSSAPIEEADSIISVTEPLDLVVAATTPAALALASRVAGRRGSRLLVFPDAVQTADWVFSLFPLSEGVSPRVEGVWEHRGSAAVKAFHDGLGPVVDRTSRHLVCTCMLPLATLLDVDVERRFLEDVDLLRLVGGDFKHLIAVAIPSTDTGHRSVTVTFGGDSSSTVSWTLQCGSEFRWRLESERAADGVLSRSADGAYALQGAAGIVEGVTAECLTPWNDVLRAFDDIAALRRSLRRRRLVELQTETITERAQFKSLMSASGCGLLVATFFGAVALLAAGAALDPRESLQRTSERSDLVLRGDDFAAGSTALTVEADAELPGMIRRLGHSAAPILIERTDSTSIDEQRRDRIIADLVSAGVASPASRVEIYAFRGGLFLTLLTIAWILLFLPLGVFLAIQALILAAPKQNFDSPDHARPT